MKKNRKLISSVVALGMAAVLALGGTFAWQSISQTALNESADVVANPGGRLHDDFNGENKDVYVENFANEPIFARVQLQEWLQFRVGYSEKQYVRGNTSHDGDKIYDTYIFSAEKLNADGTFNAGISDDAEDSMSPYWSWSVGGSTVYMPTFNKNKDSLQADVNGTYATGVDGTHYADYRTYQVGDENSGEDDYKYAVYDYDGNTADELFAQELERHWFDNELLRSYMKTGTIGANGTDDANDLNGSSIKTVAETHTARETATCAGLMSMADWLEMVEAAGGYDETLHGSYWVYDTDGWVYWSAPIPADSATGLLLDGIRLNHKLDDTWHYEIKVVGQFVTANDVGKVNGTGFYDSLEGAVPTDDAEELLSWIGVEGLLPRGELVTPNATITLTESGKPVNVGIGQTVQVLVDGKDDPTEDLDHFNMVFADDNMISFVENTGKSGDGYTYYNLYTGEEPWDAENILKGCELYVNTNTGKILLTVGGGLDVGTRYNFNFYYGASGSRYYATLTVTLTTTEGNTGE